VKIHFPQCFSGIAAATMAAALTSAPVVAHGDCGDPDQPPCTGPVPTVDQVVDLFQQLTNLDVPAANKGNIVTPVFSPDEAGTIDDHLYRMRAELPLNFVVTNIQPAPNNLAGVTLATEGWPRQHSYGRPIVLVDQGGHWMVTHDSAVAEMLVFWNTANRHLGYVG
jgi:hypothetical protein